MKKFIALLLIITLLITLTACSKTSSSTPSSKSNETTTTEADTSTGTKTTADEEVDPTVPDSDSLIIHVGDQPSFFLLKVADEKGFFEEEFAADNIVINVENFVNQGPAIVEAMAAGEVDLAILGTLPIVSANANGNKVIALASANYSEDGFGLYVTADSGITSLTDLKGKTIAAPFGTNEHQMLLGLLKNAGLTVEDVNLANMKAADSITAFQSGDIDGSIFKGQQLLAAKESGGTEIANNSETGLIVNSLVGRADFIEQYPDITARFIKVVQRAKEYIDENPEEAVEIAARLTETEIEDTRVSFESRDRLISIDSATFIDPLTSAIEFSLSEELIDKEISIEDIIDTSYYEASGVSK